MSERADEGDGRVGIGGGAGGDGDTFFATEKPPERFEPAIKRVEVFVAGSVRLGRPVVLVTSGGTIVPLERQMVRFLDNFSAGTRGAISAEWFLRHGFSVIFLHRQYSLQPFARYYRRADELVLDMFDVAAQAGSGDDGEGSVALRVKEKHCKELIRNVQEMQKYRDELGALLVLDFYTVSDYLHLLQCTALVLARAGGPVLVYLAAAVSDFYLPEARLSDHKIQSDDGTLTLRLEPVPKVISPLVKYWCPRAYIVSFKLETDAGLLVEKAQRALKRYGHDVVVANLLAERRHRVTIVRQEVAEETIDLCHDSLEIEERLVARIVELFWEKQRTS